MPYHTHIDNLIHPFPLDCTSLSILKLNTFLFVYFIGSDYNLKINFYFKLSGFYKIDFSLLLYPWYFLYYYLSYSVLSVHLKFNK